MATKAFNQVAEHSIESFLKDWFKSTAEAKPSYLPIVDEDTGEVIGRAWP